MKKKLIMSLALSLVLLATGVALSFEPSAEAVVFDDVGEGGKWDTVCCGGSCSPNPHCAGFGQFTCCY